MGEECTYGRVGAGKADSDQRRGLLHHNQLLEDIQETEKTLTSEREMVEKFEQKVAQLELQRVEMERRLVELKHLTIPSRPSPLTPQGQDAMEGGGWSL